MRVVIIDYEYYEHQSQGGVSGPSRIQDESEAFALHCTHLGTVLIRERLAATSSLKKHIE